MTKGFDLYNINYKLWRFLGIFDAKNKVKLILFISLPLVTNIFQFFYVYQSRHNFPRFIMGCLQAVMRLDCLMRLLIIVRGKAKVDKIFHDIETFYDDIKRSKNVESLENMNHASKHVNIFSMVTNGYAFFCMLLNWTIAFFSDRKLPVDIYVPGVDVFQTPLFEILFFVQLIFVAPFITLTYSPFTNLFVTWLVFGIGLLKDLKVRLGKLNEENKEEMLPALKECMKYHKRIINYIENFEELISISSFLELMIFGVILIALLALCVMCKEIVVRVGASFYILGIALTIFTQYWYTNEFSEESMEVAFAVYSIDWPNGNKELRSCVALLIQRCQDPLTIRCAGILPMTLETLQVLMKTSMSYFACLQTVHDNNNLET